MQENEEVREEIKALVLDSAGITNSDEEAPKKKTPEANSDEEIQEEVLLSVVEGGK